jgi:2-amino-4-hydroxy-6-hydroxymethyldihydropteridine diphosphokinase
MQELVIVLFGSNLGDRERVLYAAQKRLAELLGSPLSISSWYETAPWGNTNQPSFLNFIAAYKNDAEPSEILRVLLSVEQELGRIRAEPWGPRSIDLDLLFVGNRIITSTELLLPHPGIPDRRFTLIPLCELFPDAIHPLNHQSIRRLLEQCNDTTAVQLYKPSE